MRVVKRIQFTGLNRADGDTPAVERRIKTGSRSSSNRSAIYGGITDPNDHTSRERSAIYVDTDIERRSKHSAVYVDADDNMDSHTDEKTPLISDRTKEELLKQQAAQHIVQVANRTDNLLGDADRLNARVTESFPTEERKKTKVPCWKRYLCCCC